MRIQKGDMVKIISGNDKGKTGRVIKVFPDRDKIIVEGVNVVKKHSRPSQENPQGGILEKEASNFLKDFFEYISDITFLNEAKVFNWV